MMEPDAEAEVLLERIDRHIALVTLNRPRVHNAVNGAVACRLGTIAAEIERDDSIRVAVLAARGSSFCAGLDLKVASEGRIDEVVIGDVGFAGFVYAKRSKP